MAQAGLRVHMLVALGGSWVVIRGAASCNYRVPPLLTTQEPPSRS